LQPAYAQEPEPQLEQDVIPSFLQPFVSAWSGETKTQTAAAAIANNGVLGNIRIPFALTGSKI
jgi:hypothetical protein